MDDEPAADAGEQPAPEEATSPSNAEEWRRYEEWQRYLEWQRYQEWQHAHWQQWQAWQAEQQRGQQAPPTIRYGGEQGGPPTQAPPPMTEKPSFPHAEPTPYHLVLRTWSYHWWRPLVGIALLAAGMLVVVPLLALPVLLVGIAVEGGNASVEDYLDTLAKALEFTDLSPSSLLWLNLSLGGLILWTWGLIRVLHNLRPRWLSSVMPKLRWRFLWACAGVSVVALVASVAASMLIPTAGDPSLSDGSNTLTGTTVALLVVVVLTTPLQAAGEEYAFRGYLLQAVGALTKRAWLALTVTSLLFALAHGVQNFPLFFDRFAFGFIAGWLVIRTGGLEAGIALHVLNNLLAFGGAILLGDVGETLNVSEVSWWNIPVTLIQSLVYVVLVLWVARKMKVQRLSRPPAGEPVATPSEVAV